MRAAEQFDRIVFRVAVVLLAQAWSPVLHPQEVDLPPPEIRAAPITADGKIIGCTLEFMVPFRDRIYKAGGVGGATGTINLWRRNDRIFTSIKLVAGDIVGATLNRFKIHHASLFGPKGKAYESRVMPCEDDRAFCAAIPSSDPFLDVMLQTTVTGQPVRLAFNRNPGGMDVPLEFPVADGIAAKMMECSESLASPP